MQHQPIETVSVDPSVYDSPEHGQAVKVAEEIYNEVNYSIGVILTMVEAALGDSAQCKALKSLLKQELYRLYDQQNRIVYTTISPLADSLAYSPRYPQPDQEN